MKDILLIPGSHQQTLCRGGKQLVGTGFTFLMEDQIKNLKESLISSATKFSEAHKIFYLPFDSYQIKLGILSKLRGLGGITSDEYHHIRIIFKLWFENSLRVKYLDAQEPRNIAQRFIGKKNVRNFIFNRDKICLKCGADENLQLDHINPISKGGENTISNLQTLCRKCNCIKKDTYKDYRNGAR